MDEVSNFIDKVNLHEEFYDILRKNKTFVRKNSRTKIFLLNFQAMCSFKLIKLILLITLMASVPVIRFCRS